MEQKDKDQKTGSTTDSAADLQEANATGANNNEQGQASFATGATTGGGSNFGQGSSHLGGESYGQGDRTNTGSNYNNEADGIGNSSTGTSNEGASSPKAGAADAGKDTETAYFSGGNAGIEPTGSAPVSDSGNNRNDGANENEGNRSDTALEQSSGMGDDQSSSGEGRQQSGSWSRGSTSG